MITTEDNELGQFIAETLAQINRGCRLATRDGGTPMRLPESVRFTGEVVRQKNGTLITRGMTVSEQGESTSRVADNGTNTTSGTTQSTQSGSNKNTTRDEYSEKAG